MTTNILCKQTQNQQPQKDQNKRERGTQLYREWVWIRCKTVKTVS